MTETMTVTAIEVAGGTLTGTLDVIARYHDRRGRELLDLGRDGKRYVCGWSVDREAVTSKPVPAGRNPTPEPVVSSPLIESLPPPYRPLPGQRALFE